MRLARPLVLALPALLLTAAAAPASADVLTVGPSGLFADIQSALDAAADGDTVLVDPSGTYAAFTIPDLDVSVVGDGPVRVDGTIHLAALGAGRDVLLSDLHTSVFGDLMLEASGALGSVRVDTCTLRGATSVAIPQFSSVPGAVVSQSTDVAFTACDIRGGVNGAGIVVLDSEVSVVDSTVRGGSANDGGAFFLLKGGPGMFVDDDATCFVGASTITGGNGNLAIYPATPWCHDGGDGGDGLDLDIGLVRMRATQLVGGSGPSGSDPDVGCPLGGSDGAAGAPSSVSPSGTLVSLAGTQPSVTLPTLLREGQVGEAVFAGTPGDLVGLTWNPSAATAWWSDVGQQLVSFQPTLQLRLAGTLPAEGQLTVPFQVGELGPGVEGVRLFLQVLSGDPSGAVTLGSARPLVLLDAAF